MNKLKPWAKYLFLFYMGGSIYYYIEVLFRGYSYLSMFILGGICFIYCGLQNEKTSWDYSFWKQLAKSEAFVLIAEFLTGCVLNLWLGLGIWDIVIFLEIFLDRLLGSLHYYFCRYVHLELSWTII